MEGGDVSRDGFSTSKPDIPSEAVQKELMDTPDEVQNQSVKRVVMDSFAASRDGLPLLQNLPSDAQLLFWTLVDDGVWPDGYCAYFADLMGSVESAAARQARATFLDNPSADLFVHQFHKDMSQVRS